MFAVGIAQMACEVVTPVMTAEALGWRGAACGSPLSAMAMFLTLGQVSLVQLTKMGVQDRTLLLFGAACVPSVLLAAVLLWLPGGTLGEGRVLGPFLVASFAGPYAMLGSMATLTRLSMEDVPKHRGKCQAIQNNLLAMTNILAPAWLSWSYSGERMHRERVPLTCIACLALADFVALAWMLTSYWDLRPASAGVRPAVAQPLLAGGK